MVDVDMLQQLHMLARWRESRPRESALYYHLAVYMEKYGNVGMIVVLIHECDAVSSPSYCPTQIHCCLKYPEYLLFRRLCTSYLRSSSLPMYVST